ncbi:hypothetical protein GCM10022234_07680 [Aeromicrobium panaciterrae]|uniref:hypothetical protein n=1 Tax=Aeromicrobium panaciterrae TaxID=363861 RepID=UPI0031D7ED0F
MKTAAMAVIGLFLTATLTACGGGGDPEADARAELKDLGLSKSMTDCALADIKKQAGSLEKYMDLSAKKQQTIAAAAGSKCATNMSEEEVGDLTDTLDDQGVDFSDPALRDSFVTGMTTQGVPKDVANCILDKMIDKKLKLSDATNPEIITKLAQECQ